jgi:hypothetical protein
MSTYSYRHQQLYLASEINCSGLLDKFAYGLSGSPGGSATLSNFKLILCNTPVTALTSDFTSNYGVGGTPVKVIDTPSFQMADVGGWLPFDPPNNFFYDNTKNLLIEVSFSDRSGTSYTLLCSGLSARRCYATAYDATTGSVQDRCPDVRLEFLSKTNMTVDLCADSKIDYVNPSDNWNNTEISFTQALANYTAAASLNFTDAYGIGFVTVPICISMDFGGSVMLSNLSVVYEYTAIINESPALGNLAEGMNAVLPKTYDG